MSYNRPPSGEVAGVCRWLYSYMPSTFLIPEVGSLSIEGCDVLGKVQKPQNILHALHRVWLEFEMVVTS